jgi:hypothetical protein
MVNWIPKNLKKGSYTAHVKRDHKGSIAKAIRKDRHSKNATTRKRGVLAATFRKMAARRRRK